MAFFCVHGEEPAGKALLGKIKSNQYVVTNETDQTFLDWKDGQEIKFPNSDTNSFWIGEKTLAELISQKELDPVFKNWRNSSWNLSAGYNTYAG